MIKINNNNFYRIFEIIKINENTFKQINDYVNFLLLYNKKINLISKSTENDIWNRHIIDSIQIIKLIDNFNFKIADIGSGAGLPGIPLSIIGIKEIDLYEKSYRKCEFLEKAKKFSSNKIVIKNKNLNNIDNKIYDIIVSRALANINILLQYCIKLSKKNTQLIFLKGKKINEEILESKKYWNFEYELFDSITSNEGKIIKIKNFKQKF